MKRILVWSLLALGAEAEPLLLSREAASRMALASHPRLKAAVAQVVQAREQIGIAASPGHPQVNLTMSRLAQTTTRGIPVSTTLFGIQQTFQADSINYQQSHFALEVRQLLYDGGELAAQLHSLEATRDQACANLAATAHQLHLDTQLAFLELAEARLRWQAADAALAVARRSLEATRARYAAGSAAEADIVYARVDVARAELTRTEANRRIEQAQIGLDRLIGVPQDTQLTLTAEATPEPQVNLAQCLEESARQRPELRAAERQKDAARFALQQADRSGGPKIYGVGAAEGVGYGNDIFPTSPGWRVSVDLAWPLYDGGLAEHQEARAQAVLDEIEARRLELSQDVEQQVRQAYSSWQVARQGLSLSTAQRDQTEKALAMATGQYEVGYATILQVSQAQSNHLQAETELAAARMEVERARLRLDFARGSEPPDWKDVIPAVTP